MAASRDVLEDVKAKLNDELETIRKELVDLGASPDGSMEVDLDEGFADAAQATSERSKIVSMVEALKARLENVRAALARIEAGTYGRCVNCGNEIDPERLDAIPSASTCITCARIG